MRIGYTSIGFLDYDMEKVAEFLKRTGYDSIELIYYPENWSRHLPDPEAFLSNCKKIGLDIVSFRFIAGTDDKSLEEGQKLIDIAQFFGCKIVDIKVQSPIPEIAIEQDYEAVADAVKCLGRFAAEKGLKVVIETHPGVLHESAVAARKIIDKVGLPNVGVNYDQSNLSYAGREEPDNALEVLKGKIEFVHLKNGWFRDRSPVWTPLEDGRIDNLKLIRTLLRQGYKGEFMVEMPSGGDPFVRAEKDLKYLRGIERFIENY